MLDKKLIYILNHYSKNSHSHFFHVTNLLEAMAAKGVKIALVIEKCDDIPEIENANIEVFAQSKKKKWSRLFELSKILSRLNKQDFSSIYIRISWVAAVVAILTSFFTRQKTYYWLSGQGGFEHYKNLSFGIEKIKLFVGSRLPFFFIRKFVYRFVTGPETMRDYFANEGGVDINKIMVLYNDIDIERFTILKEEERENLKLRLGLPIDKKVVFFAHRFSPVRKTLYYLPFIFEHFSEKTNEDYLIVIAGSGPEEAELKKIVEEKVKKQKVIFLGSIPNAVIQEYYQIADIFINPTYAEGFPRVLIEAMASGLPIVTTDAGGIKDILGLEQSKYMVQKNDRNAFANKLIELANNSETRDLLMKENLITVRRFSTETVAEMYINQLF